MAMSAVLQRKVREQMDILLSGVAEIISIDELEAKVARSLQTGEPLRVKLGTDPSRPDIHLGHAVVYRKLAQFQKLGHQVIFLIGDFTGMVGDPTGKSSTRPALTREEVEENARSFVAQFKALLDPERTELRFNSEWLAKMSFRDVIDLASRYTVARMLERDDFAKRFATQRPIGIHEFLYPLMQGYDSVALRADVELGGTDQKFNLLVGRELQREWGQEPQVVMMMPLLVGLDGVQKMSKSLDNYVAIADPPAVMYGKIMSVADAVMPMYFQLASGLPPEEVRRVQQQLSEGTLHPRDAKRMLAKSVVELYHGTEAAEAAEQEFDRVFRQHLAPEDTPEVQISAADWADGHPWIVRLLVAAGLAGSSSEARRLIQQGGVRLNGNQVTDADAHLEIKEGDLLQVGRRRFARLRRGRA
ncbi:MAG: tyrosine--tRNA ligase [Firmicutes bacterium]|nr:tyrosine--tRNA ligase [Bacillota bacterium]